MSGDVARGPDDVAAPPRRVVHVVVHTHWDREWYLDRETTLARLHAVVEQVLGQLESGTLPHFLFDGQTVALRDLLARATPDFAARVGAQIRAGRLVLGPWYVAADEFLASGEALLRNLEFGLADARALGAPDAAVNRIGYLVDTFGHAAQMPRLLAEAGIGHALVWRGADAVQDRFDWVGADGTVVPTVALPEGYYQIPLHGADWQTALTVLLDKLEPRAPAAVAAVAASPAAPLLLLHGGDHLAPTPQLAERIAAFNGMQSRFELRLATLAEHAAAVFAPPDSPQAAPRERIEGELRHNEQAFVLPDVLSTRRHLKLVHQQCEDRLLGEIEPLLAQLDCTASTEAAWRTLIEQQAHDSICGCSTDAVHAEMAQRFVHLGQQLDALRQAALAHGGLVELHRHLPSTGGANSAGTADVFADDTRCTLFNPLPQARRGWWTATLFLHGPAPAALRLRTLEGTELPCEVIGAVPHTELISPLDDFPEPRSGHRVDVVVHAEMRGLGAVALVAEPLPQPSAASGQGGKTIENAAWHVGLANDGSLRLHDKRSDRRIECAFVLTSELDAGDSYNFSPPPEPLCTHAERWQLLHVQHGAVVQDMALALDIELPAGLDATRRGASGAKVPQRAMLRLRLVANDPILHTQLTWQNQALDHRLRLLLPWLDGADGSTTHSDSACAWIARQPRPAQIPTAPSSREMPVAVFPSLSAVAAGGWAVAHRALHEHGVVEHAGRRFLALTLLRSVGWLSRRDLRTRGVGAGPDIATPGAQCPGEHRFDFTLRALHRGEGGEGGEASEVALQDAQALRRPPLLLRGHGTHWLAPVDIGNRLVQTSAVRRRPDGQVELRLWNPTGMAQPLALQGASVPPHGLLTLRLPPPAP
jgi:mannosylglycerate hydrolase